MRLLLALFLAMLSAIPAQAQSFPVGTGFGIKPAKATAHYVVTQSEPSLPNSTVVSLGGLGTLTSFDVTNNASSLLTFSGVPDSSGAVVLTIGLATGQTANRAIITNGSGAIGLGQIDLGTSIITGSLPQANVASLVSDLAGKAASVHTHAQSDVTNLVSDLGAKLTNPLTTTGDMIYSSSGSTGARLAAVVAGKVIQSAGTSTAPVYSPWKLPTSIGSSGKVLYSNGTDYVESTPTLPLSSSASSGKLLQSDGTNFVASTPTFPTTAGTSGKILVSDGTNIVSSTPTFPNASATSGKIIKSDGTNWVASTETYAAPGTSGHVLTSDGTNWTSAAPAGGAFDPLTTIQVYEDFLTNIDSGSTATDDNNMHGIEFVVSGTGAQVLSDNGDADVNHHGIVKLFTGTGSTGRATLHDEMSGSLTGGAATFIASAGRLSAASSGTQRYTIRVGFSNLVTGGGADEILFRYVDNVNSGNWQCVCRKDSSESVINTSTAPSTSAFQTLKFVVNSTATSVEFFINGSSQGTITTNIPVSGDPVGSHVSIVKSIGTTSRDFQVDFVYWTKTVSRSSG